MANIYGYIRVSTRDQNEDRQLIALRDLNIPEKNIFMDKQSGKDFNRPTLCTFFPHEFQVEVVQPVIG